MWKRLKNLWYLSGLELKPSNDTSHRAKSIVKKLTEGLLSNKKMAVIIDTKDTEDLFPNEEENETDDN